MPDLNKINFIDQYPTKKYFKQFVSNFNNFKGISKHWEETQIKLNLDKKVKFLKTHHVNCSIDNKMFTNLKNTLGVIHVVRDPRNVITSLKNHYSKKTYEEAYDFISDPLHCVDLENKSHEGLDKNLIMNTLISSWNSHYNSWSNYSNNYLLIRYEDLERDPIKTFTTLVDYLKSTLKIKIETSKLNEIINMNNFENLKKMETENGFREAPIDENDNIKEFFYLGPKNKWEKLLPLNIKKRLEKIFEKEMKILNYL